MCLSSASAVPSRIRTIGAVSITANASELFAVMHLTAKSDILMRRLEAVLKAIRPDPDLSPRQKNLS